MTLFLYFCFTNAFFNSILMDRSNVIAIPVRSPVNPEKKSQFYRFLYFNIWILVIYFFIFIKHSIKLFGSTIIYMIIVFSY